MPDKPNYPLRFEHEEFARVEKRGFDQDTVFATFERILVGYGVKKLLLLLSDAADANERQRTSTFLSVCMHFRSTVVIIRSTGGITTVVCS
jgi:hypothetical protein